MSLLEGKRILVVEDEYHLAADISAALRQQGATVLGPAPTANYGLSLISSRGADGAILDIRLHNLDVYGLADVLAAQNVPWAFATAAAQNQIPERFRAVPVLTKPYLVEQIVPTILSLLEGPMPDVVPEQACAATRYRMEQVIISALDRRYSPPGRAERR